MRVDVSNPGGSALFFLPSSQTQAVPHYFFCLPVCVTTYILSISLGQGIRTDTGFSDDVVG